jgi:hypothetical protein
MALKTPSFEVLRDKKWTWGWLGIIIVIKLVRGGWILE